MNKIGILVEVSDNLQENKDTKCVWEITDIYFSKLYGYRNKDMTKIRVLNKEKILVYFLVQVGKYFMFLHLLQI